jgi:hypothetical protein
MCPDGYVFCHDALQFDREFRSWWTAPTDLKRRGTAADNQSMPLTEALAAAGPRTRGLSLVLGFTLLMGALWIWALYTGRTRYQRVRRARAVADAEANHTVPDPNAGRAKPLEFVVMAAIWLAVIAYEIVLTVSAWGR